MIAYCVFENGDRRLAVDISAVTENIPWPDVTPVPFQPPFVMGLFNLRGKIIPLVKLESFVGGVERPFRKEDRAVIVERGHFRFGTVANSMSVVEVDPESILPHSQASLFPSLSGTVATTENQFDVIQLERLGAAMAQALQFEHLVA